MKITCNIIEDLLPLYVDDMVSEDSRQLVEEHLKMCPACRKMQEEMQRENRLTAAPKGNNSIQINKTEADMRNEFKEQAERSVKSRLVLDAIAKAEKLENSEEEIAEKIKEMAENYGKKEEELLKNEQLKNYLEENMKTEKAIKFIVENAKIK